jgi:hypothetical protein
MEQVVRSLASGAAFLALITAVGSCGAERDDEMASAPVGGDVEITPFVGAGVPVEFGGTVIHVDP